MAKLYIPQLKDKIRLTAPLTITMAETARAAPSWSYNQDPRNSNLEEAWRIVQGEAPWDPFEAEKIPDYTLEEGTVLEFRRYFVSVAAKTNDVEVGIFASPRRDLTPKKQGGTSTLIKLVLPTQVLNRIEYEVVNV